MFLSLSLYPSPFLHWYSPMGPLCAPPPLTPPPFDPAPSNRRHTDTKPTSNHHTHNHNEPPRPPDEYNLNPGLEWDDEFPGRCNTTPRLDLSSFTEFWFCFSPFIMIVFFYNISTVYLLGSFVAVRHRFGFGLAWLLVSAICFLVFFFGLDCLFVFFCLRLGIAHRLPHRVVAGRSTSFPLTHTLSLSLTHSLTRSPRSPQFDWLNGISFSTTIGLARMSSSSSSSFQLCHRVPWSEHDPAGAF